MRDSIDSRVIAAYAGMCLIWGTTWLFIKVGLAYVPPFTGVGMRFIIAGAALFAVAAATRRLRPVREWPWKVIAVFGIGLFGLNYVLNYIAETRLDSGLVAVLFGTTPFFTFFFGGLLAHERTTPRVWMGAALAFVGVGIISLGGQVQGSPLYALATIGAACSSAFANVYAKRHAHHAPLVTLPPSMLLSGALVLALGLATEHANWHAALSPPSLAVIAYLALFGSGLAFFLNIWVISRIPVWVVGLSALIIPVIAVAVGTLAGGEHVSPRELLGALGVIAGVWIALAGGRREQPAISERP